MSGFYIQQMASPETLELMRRPDAFVMLAQIALRARRRGSLALDELQPGEALIGDFRSIGLTARRYRTAKATLERGGLVTFKATNRGTIATLASDTVFRVLGINADEPAGAEATSERPASDQPATTNLKKKREKKERKQEGAAAPVEVFAALLAEERFRRLDAPEMRAAYAAWCQYRHEIKKPVTSRAVEMDCQHMLAILDAGGAAVEIKNRMDRAVGAGWRGWYFPDQPGQRPGQSGAAPGSARTADDAAERYRKTFTGA
ncbi:MAG: hypothetical protein NTV49_05255 [Kiritimatiellaeota bacterium]|nr:hypothetical protein [Kiritimatiellota bacterium]